jgi:pyrroline-5-carboxylate reductase
MMGQVLDAISQASKETAPLIVSIAAGVREPDIRRRLGYDAAIVRTMPNTPALLGCGASALYANDNVSAEQRSRAESVLRAVGITVWVDEENRLDAVTALSGSGPAYYFLLMELMEESGVEMGLGREAARALTLQTALGAARMANETDETPATLRKRVTSPGGTTQAALQSLEDAAIAKVVSKALEAARDRAIELGDELGSD